MYKFRSMCIDAEEKLKKLKHKNETEGPTFKMQEDPRITKVGHFIRKYSIDELLQLVNILKGDMSIIGPRPALPREVAEYGEFDKLRLLVKPGLSCYWQVSGRSNIPFDEWMKLDVKYIKEMSLLTDIKIILLTSLLFLRAMERTNICKKHRRLFYAFFCVVFGIVCVLILC